MCKNSFYVFDYHKSTNVRNYTQVKKILTFVFLITTSTAMEERETTKLTIKKCCPKGQELNSNLMCVNVTRDSKNNSPKGLGMEQSYFENDSSKILFPDSNETTSEKLLEWFPFPSVISSVTLESVTDLNFIKSKLSKINFEYGERPKCHPSEKEFSCFRRNYSQQFYLILYPDEDIKLYISKKSSYHDGGHFKVESQNCGFSKIDPGENHTKEKGNDLREKSLFNLQELRTFPVEDFCLDKGPNESFLVEYCPCKTIPCVRKCCGDSEMYDKNKEKCVQNLSPHVWRPNLLNSSLTKNYYLLTNRYPSTCEKPQLIKSFPNLKSKSKGSCRSEALQEDINKFHFLFDGSLQVEDYQITIPEQYFCGDHVLDDSNQFSENNFLVCPTDDKSQEKFRVYGSLCIIGGILLVVTIVISLYLRELRTSVFDRVIISHNVCLMLANFIWGSTHLLSHVSYNLCVFLSLAMQATFLGSVFWMNVMCLDVFWSLRSLKFNKEIVNENFKFLRYITYACGSSIIITFITAGIELAPSLPSNYIRPGFGCFNCGFDPGSVSILIYLYGPIIIIIVFSMIFYLWTIIDIIKIERDSLMVQFSAKMVIKARFVLCSKIFLLLGLSWMLEIISWLVAEDDYYWHLPDFINLIRGVLIFVILICKKDVVKSLIEKTKCLDGYFRSRTSTASELELDEIKRREKILQKQITQTFCEFED